MSESSSSEMGVQPKIDYHNFYEASQDKVFLEPRLALQEFNKRLPQYYSAEKAPQAEQFQVLDSGEIQKLVLNRSPELRDSDIHIIQTMAQYLSKSRAEYANEDKELKATEDILKAIGTYLELSYNRDRIQSKNSKANSLKSRIRRTAALIYKNARIPGQRIAEGGFKKVVGPLGIDHTNTDIERFDDIVNSIPVPLWQWDGNLKDIDLSQAQGSSANAEPAPQRIRMWEKATVEKSGPHMLLEERPIKLENRSGNIQVIDEGEISLDEEVTFINLMRSELKNPQYLPAVFQTKFQDENVQYMEYIPYSFHSENSAQSSVNLSKLGSGLQELWLKEGIVNHDIKYDNIRMRHDGSPVIIDWGFFSWLKPGEKTVDVTKISGYSPPNVDPDIIMKLHYSFVKSPVDIEKRIVYQLACIGLNDLFGTDLPKELLVEKKAGFKWPFSIVEKGEEKEGYSLSDATFYECWKHQPDRKFPKSLVNMITVGLRPRARDRMPLQDMIQTLASVTPEDTMLSYQEAIQLQTAPKAPTT